MKHLLLSLIVILSACTQTDDLALYKTNLEITKKVILLRSGIIDEIWIFDESELDLLL